MPVVDVTVGTDHYPGLEVPEGCSVGKWKESLAQGKIGGQKVQFSSRLICRGERGGQPLGDAAPLPKPPASLVVEGPPYLVKALAGALQQQVDPNAASTGGLGVGGGSGRVVIPLSARGHSSSRKPSSSMTPRAQSRMPNSARLMGHRSTQRGAGGNRSGTEESTAVLDGEAAKEVLNFWFEELTTEDWFRQSHALDDRVRRDFGSLHQRAAAGELAGWMGTPATCLALVIILDQFSRNIYGRGTPEGCAWDAMARAAANAALARGDDRQHWPPGPKRSALYLPFMHSEDLADKRRCVALMREGLQPDKDRRDPSSVTEASAGACAVASSGGGQAAGGGSGQGAAAGVVKTPRAGGTAGLPRLQAAATSSLVRGGGRGCGTSARQPGAGAGAATRAVKIVSSQGAGTGGAGVGDARRSAADDLLEDSDVSSDSDMDGDGFFGAGRTFGGANGFGGMSRGVSGLGTGSGGGGISVGGSGVAGGGRHAGSNGLLSEETIGSYNMQAALELPQLPVLSLNHEHAKRFRTMKLDAQTQQAYLRDRKDVNRTVRYQCLVCAVTHEFKLSKSAASGAEQQHQHA
mmetsp:Transcript_105459/g.264031  ORF Transcript_105459/g.264031 Transcript_105459/m.264031 type:complete len:578 (+) Transcript_105459:222-1955(+)